MKPKPMEMISAENGDFVNLAGQTGLGGFTRLRRITLSHSHAAILNSFWMKAVDLILPNNAMEPTLDSAAHGTPLVSRTRRTR